eukprot:SAG11_NODE_1463_length_4863_cov_15.348657_3_plen_89_part_00
MLQTRSRSGEPLLTSAPPQLGARCTRAVFDMSVCVAEQFATRHFQTAFSNGHLDGMRAAALAAHLDPVLQAECNEWPRHIKTLATDFG